MFEEMKKINLSGKDIPIKCDLVVLEALQEEFGTLEEAEKGLDTFVPALDPEGKPITKQDKDVTYVVGSRKIPRIKVVTAALYYMTTEAAEINRTEKPFVSVEDAARSCDRNMIEIAMELYEEFKRAFVIKN